MVFFRGVLQDKDIKAPRVRPESVFYGRDNDLLKTMFSFYAPNAEVVRDVTANTRKMWKGNIFPFKPRFYDIDPRMKPDVVCDFGKLPDKKDSVDVLIYDPPHLDNGIGLVMEKDYGLSMAVKKTKDIPSLYPRFLAEAKRVLKPGGYVFAKIKDYTGGDYRWNLFAFVEGAKKIGLDGYDLIIKRDPSGGL